MNDAIIDVHAHYQPRSLNAFMGRFSQAIVLPNVPWTDTTEHIEERVQLMDRARVRLQILSPGSAHYFEDPVSACEVVHILNDSFAQLVEKLPTRFAAYVSLPLPHIDASLRELDRSSRMRGMVGVTLHCSILGKSVAAPEFDPIYEELNRRRSILFLHPCRNGICSALVNDYQLAESVGTSVEDSLATLHMIIRQIPQRFPNIRIIVPHLGGILPMLLERLDNQLPKVHLHLPEPPSITARRFWYDTVSHGSRAALRCACDSLGSERLLPGSDYPFLLLHEPYERAFSYIESSAIPQLGITHILCTNAQGLFGH